VFLWLGVLSNVVGLVYVLGLLRRHGLFPGRPSVLSRVLRVPFDKAFVPGIAVAVLIFVVVLLKEAT
jgi:hypothetical protein